MPRNPPKPHGARVAPDGRWWRTPGTGGASVEVVDWGPSAPNEMITLNALRVLHAAGRLR